jgi:wyosine [tRNA(Phe)-imidazoG37] synthetase (radical SAM superfamily)
MKHVFGPVPSRRLGRSLGIDPIPFKTCNWNCIYCQLGRTSPLTVRREEFIAAEEILEQVRAAVAGRAASEIDWITFVGSGEPTLHARLGEMIREVKSFTTLPVAVITNGSMLHDATVRQELLAADAVLPSVDAGSEELYRRINRPAPQLDFRRFIEGLVQFRAEYAGKFWVEVMLIKGVNDTEEALQLLSAVLEQIRPDEVHINVPVRPPTEPWVEPPGEEAVLRALALLGRSARVLHPAQGDFDLSGFTDLTEAVVAVITRHPMSEEELLRALARWQPEEVQRVLGQLEAGGRAQVVTRYGKRFWSSVRARYIPGKADSLEKRYPGCV